MLGWECDWKKSADDLTILDLVPTIFVKRRFVNHLASVVDELLTAQFQYEPK